MDAVRAKFRCMEITHDWEGRRRVLLRPVTATSPGAPADQRDENAAYWKASPSGELSLQFRGPDEQLLEPGAFYYVDLHEARGSGADPHDREWVLSFLGLSATNIEVKLYANWDEHSQLIQGTLTLGIDNQDAWPIFMGKLGSSWHIELSRL